MSPQSGASSYAAAFYEAAVERWLHGLKDAADRLAREPGLLARLESGEPLSGSASLVPVDADPALRNLVALLIQRRDLGSLNDVAAELERHAFKSGQGPLGVEVVSAVPLSADEVQQLGVQLAQQYGDALNISYRVDPAILGGMIIRAGDKLIDASVSTRLAAMKQSLHVADLTQRPA
jgi:F-type H+-transporting ATPase subunit delta